MTEAEMQRQEAVVEAVLFTMGKSVETGGGTGVHDGGGRGRGRATGKAL